MHWTDVFWFSLKTLRGGRMRTWLMLLAMGIGVASVVILTSLGEAARRYVTGEFASLGTHLIIVLPGKSETSGGPMFSTTTTRDITVADAVALRKNRQVVRVAPLVIGAARVSWQRRDREAVILGSTAELLQVRQWKLGQGRFLSVGDPEQAQAEAVLGAKMRDELFGLQSALGQWIRIGDRRFRVVGILATQGRSIGMDVEELVIIPVASAQTLLNAPSLFRVMVEARSRESLEDVKNFVVESMKSRHQGEEDVTVITQDSVLATFDRIFVALTLTVAGIAGISLAVAGILIMNVMLISVSQRTAEIGLLKAIGAPRRQILWLILVEAVLLSSAGAAAGLVAGEIGSWSIGQVYPNLPMGAPAWAIVASVLIAIVSGLLFGVLPARRAARLDPVQALARR